MCLVLHAPGGRQGSGRLHRPSVPLWAGGRATPTRSDLEQTATSRLLNGRLCSVHLPPKMRRQRFFDLELPRFGGHGFLTFHAAWSA